MKNWFIGLFLLALVLAGVAAVTLDPVRQQRDLRIVNSFNTVGLTIEKAESQSTNALEIWRGDTLEFAVPGTNTASGLKSNLGIETGQCVTTGDGTVTNTFTTAYSAAPTVIIGGYGTTYSATNSVTSVTTTNFIVYTKDEGVTNNWVAIGAR